MLHKILLSSVFVFSLTVVTANAEKVVGVVAQGTQNIEEGTDLVHIAFNATDQHAHTVSREVTFSYGLPVPHIVNAIKDTLVQAFYEIGVNTSRNEIIIFGGPIKE